jgi:hypothetical protein
MTLEDDTISPVPTIPTALLAGIITDDPRDESTDDAIQALLASALTSNQTLTWEQVQNGHDLRRGYDPTTIEDWFPEKRCIHGTY